MQDLTGTWRGSVQVYKYQNSLRVRLMAGAQKMERRYDPINGGYTSVATGVYLDETQLRVPRNIRHYVSREDGGYGTSAQWRVNSTVFADLNIRSERHCSVFLVSDVDTDTPAPQPELGGCTECNTYHKFGYDCDRGCVPSANGDEWAHKPTCSKAMHSDPSPVKANTVPSRPTDPDYIGTIERMATVCNRDGFVYPIGMVGPSQCGKTSIAVEIAKRRAAKLFANSFSMGITEYDLLGRLATTREAGVFQWQDSQFIQAFESENSVYLADEFDAGDENTILAFNTALAQGWVVINQRYDAPMAKRKLSNLILLAMNTYGTGSNIYVGRNQQDGSTRQRYNPISIDYNPAWEWDVVYGENAVSVERSDRDALMALTTKTRKAIKDGKLRQIWSTTNITMAMAMMAAGFTLQDYMREQFAAWSDPERLVLTNNDVQVPARV